MSDQLTAINADIQSLKTQVAELSQTSQQASGGGYPKISTGTYYQYTVVDLPVDQIADSNRYYQQQGQPLAQTTTTEYQSMKISHNIHRIVHMVTRDCDIVIQGAPNPTVAVIQFDNTGNRTKREIENDLAKSDVNIKLFNGQFVVRHIWSSIKSYDVINFRAKRGSVIAIVPLSPETNVLKNNDRFPLRILSTLQTDTSRHLLNIPINIYELYNS